MDKLTNPKTTRIFEVLFFSGALISILWSIYFSLVTISIPYQIELREGTAQVMTEILLKGGNPFAFDNQPLAMNNYGIGYNLAVYPFAVLFGNTLAVHRTVTFLFIILSAVLGFLAVHKKNKSTPLALSCAAFIMIGLIGRGGIGAFPASMGTFLFLLALFVSFVQSFDRVGLVWSLLISLFAFYTKPYFILSFGIVISYLFLFVSKKKGVMYGLAFLVVFALSLLAVDRLLPLYFINTIVGNVSNAYGSVDNLFSQLRFLFFSFYPVLLVMIIMLGLRLVVNQKRLTQIGDGLLNVSTWDRPFVEPSFDFSLYSFLCCLLAFLLILGPHIGNYLNYAFQLLIPTFFCWFLGELGQLQKLKVLFITIVLLNLFTWEYDLLNPVMLKQRDSKEWSQVNEYLYASSVTLNSPATASSVVALGQIPMDSGQTAYYYEVEPFSKSLFTRISYDEFYSDGFRYMLLVDRMIEKQRFDLIITTAEKASFYHQKILSTYYQQVDKIKVDMPQTGQVWTLEIWKRLTK